MRSGHFKSFFMGGFECSTHRDARGRRLDLIASTRHDEFAERDYARLMELGLATCRDGTRWHLIEREPYRYDFSSLESQVAAAKATRIQVIWDYFHYGYPDDLDIFSDEFIPRFSEFSRALTRYLTESLGPQLFVCPVNEISFFSWIATRPGGFYPAARNRATELKRQLVRSAVASVDAIRAECPTAAIMVTDPAIHVVTNKTTPSARRAAESYRKAQFQAFDMLMGRTAPELGGNSKVFDIVGLNYYFHNQWHHSNRRKIPPGHRLYRPLCEILAEFERRYEKPLLIAETGIEDDERPEWFRYVCEQTAAAHSLEVRLDGVCLYPIANHPGWADDRHCHNGLWDYAADDGHREIYQPLADEIRFQQAQFAERSAVAEFQRTS